MKAALPTLTAIGLIALLCWAYPPLHIRSVKHVKAEAANAAFNPTDFVTQFWSATLLPAANQATEATEVMALLAASPGKVRERFGRTVGVSSSYFLFLRGTGRVVSADGDSIGLSLRAEGNGVDISIPLGLVFGNAVRDGTGLLNSSSYPNAQEFNDISAALNHIVETRVLPEFQRIAKVGSKVLFVGCVEVSDEDSDLKPLKLSPISVKVE
jgi:predicted lipoprotein